MQDVEELLAGGGRGGLLDGALSLGSDELLSSEGLGVRVESEENSLVSEGVLLLGEGSCGSALHIDQVLHARLATAWPAGRRTDWISSELINRVTSEVEILAVGRLKPDFRL